MRTCNTKHKQEWLTGASDLVKRGNCPIIFLRRTHTSHVGQRGIQGLWVYRGSNLAKQCSHLVGVEFRHLDWLFFPSR